MADEEEEKQEVQDPEVTKLLKKHKEETFNDLTKQVQAEYTLCHLNQQGRLEEHLTRLKLFNNQKRDKDLIGDPLMFTIFQTVLASLYSDRLSVTYEGKEEGDNEVAQNLNYLATYDAEIVEKPVLDYEWVWDTLFFGRGLLLMLEFDRSEEFMCPVPENIDAMTFLHHPYAKSVNGDRKGRGQMNFGGREVELTRWQMRDGNGYFNLKNLKAGSKALNSMIERAKQARTEAQGLDQNLSDILKTENFFDNTPFGLLEWYTHWKGKKVIVTLGNEMREVVRFQEVGPSKSRWPLIDRPLYPSSHTWEGVSIPDLTEDKQRQRSVALNLGMNMMKSDLYPSYAYDEKKIKNKADLQNIEFNKFVPVDAKGSDVRSAIQPINKATPNMQLLDFIVNSLDLSAQKATATPDIQQGVQSSQSRPLGETNLIASRVDTRYSLSAKVFGWSERRYHQQSYFLYKKHYKDKIDEKIIRVAGAFGNKWRPLTRANIIASVDPDITIESAILAEDRNFKERIMLTAYGSAYVLPDPAANKRYFQKHLGKLNNLSHDQIERLFPATVEELRAEDENQLLNKDQLPTIDATDDHIVHLEIHSKAAETDAKKAHMEAHKQAMTIQRRQPELFVNPAEAMLQEQNGATGAQPTNQSLPLGALADAAKATPSSSAAPVIQ